MFIAASSQFHGQPKEVGLEKSTIFAKAVEASNFEGLEADALAAKQAETYAALPRATQESITAELKVAGMMEKRSQWDLAKALAPFVGDKVSQYLFGIGVLAMALSTIIILMLINGFAICEATGVDPGGSAIQSRRYHRRCRGLLRSHRLGQCRCLAGHSHLDHWSHLSPHRLPSILPHDELQSAARRCKT